ncbi:hypothetical protein B1813_00785 [Saccharomonospora piscinae]|uniref:HTH luxR-type domain-containing protein n=1 Tax=Saccharomonospora piscinae TaxID=687388 RepID=A0A1V9AC07_SACPI|nr:response regulator transcription factor [Saccharomonospora piscinae]OQO94675.1 hypothetical protein B1813_00785 [Saccharomonospora piscinae]
MLNHSPTVIAVEGSGSDAARPDGERKISVLVAHPDEVISNGLESLVARMPGTGQSHVCEDWPTLTTRLADREHDRLLLVSHRMVRTDAAKMSSIRDSSIKVVLLLQGVDNAEVADAADLRPDGFLVEGNISVGALDEAIRAIWRGQLYVPPELTKGLLDEIQRPSKIGFTGVNLLTPRERDTLKLLAEGYSNKQIATRLGISINGVKRHVGNVLAKLNCPNRTLAAAEAVRLDII